MENQASPNDMDATPQREAAALDAVEAKIATEDAAVEAVPEQFTEDHIVTKSDLENNPALSENGVSEGDVVSIETDQALSEERAIDCIDEDHSFVFEDSPSDPLPTGIGKAISETQDEVGDKTDLPLSY